MINFVPLLLVTHSNIWKLSSWFFFLKLYSEADSHELLIIMSFAHLFSFLLGPANYEYFITMPIPLYNKHEAETVTASSITQKINWAH